MSELNMGRELWKHCYQYIKLGPSELKQKQQQNFSILTLIRLEVIKYIRTVPMNMNFLPFLYEKLYKKISLNNKHIYGMYSEYFILNLNRERFNLSVTLLISC